VLDHHVHRPGLNTDISKGVFDRFRSLPIWRPAVLVGMLLADTVRYLVASVVIISLGLALGFRPHGGPLGVVARWALLLVFAFSLSGCGLPSACACRHRRRHADEHDRALPVTFASNVFVDPHTMPGWVRCSSTTTRSPI